jgi:hypothetical protein
MANRLLGEATTTLDGKVYTLRFDFNAMCAFEEATGLEALAAFEAFETGALKKASDLRAMVWAMLQRHHPAATLAEAGDILSADADVLRRVMIAAAPVVTEDATGNGQRRAHPRPA